MFAPQCVCVSQGTPLSTGDTRVGQTTGEKGGGCMTCEKQGCGPRGRLCVSFVGHHLSVNENYCTLLPL